MLFNAIQYQVRIAESNPSFTEILIVHGSLIAFHLFPFSNKPVVQINWTIHFLARVHRRCLA